MEDASKTKLVKPIASSFDMYTCAPHRSIPGHTGYLTFATLFHKTEHIEEYTKTSTSSTVH